MVKDYKKSQIVVKNYNELIEQLKLIDVSSQEAYSLAFKNKFNYDARHFWTMYRITEYLRIRMKYAVNLKSEYNIEIKSPKKLWNLYHKELKEEKWHNKKVLAGYAPNMKKTGKFWDTMFYVDPAYWSDLINVVLENKEIIKLIKTKMPKRIDTCRKVLFYRDWKEKKVKFKWIEDQFHSWLPNKKVDIYQEVQNLSKLVTDKRHNHKFSPDYLDIRKLPNWKKIKWENHDWHSRLKHTPQKTFDEINEVYRQWHKRMPDFAKAAYGWMTAPGRDLKLEDWRFFDVRQYLLKHDWYGGKVNQFKYYTQKNINLIR